MHFVTDDQIAMAVTEAIRQAGSLKLAVAFWGKGVTNLIGLDAFAGRARIVCDAYSGACNPDVLAHLMVRHEVRTLTGMHAKVYWTSDFVIVGSANASSNGLRSEAGALRYEAAIVTRDPAMLTDIEAWFDATFDKADALKEGSLAYIRRRWEEAQARRPSSAAASGTLLQALLDTPDDLANRRVFVIVLEQGDASTGAIEAYERVRGALYRPEEVQSYEEAGTMPFYEDHDGSAWDVRAGDIFLDLSRGSRGKLSFSGIWQVRNNGWRHPAGEDGSIILVDLVDHVDGRVLDPTEAKKLSKAVKRMIKADKDGYTDDGFCRPLYEIREYLEA